MSVKDSTEQATRLKLIPTNSDPYKAERLRKEWLYSSGFNSIVGYFNRIWNSFRTVNKRLDEIEDRLAKLDGISSPRHIYHPPNVTEYFIEEFIKDDESG